MVTKARFKFVAHCFLQRKRSHANVFQSFGTFSNECQPFSVWMQKEIVKCLRSGNKDRAFSLLYELSSTNQALEAKDFNSIFWYCAKAPDPLFARETYNLIRQKGIKLNDKCYLLAVRALCGGGNLEEAFSFCNNILNKKLDEEDDDVNLSLPAYNILLKTCVRSKNANYVANCLHLMDDNRMGKNRMTYANLLKLAESNKDRTWVYTIWKDHLSSYGTSIMTLHRYICSFVRIKDLDSALTALQQMLALVCQHLSGTSKGRLFDSRLDIPIPLRTEDFWDKCNKENYNGIRSTFLCKKEGELNKELKFDLESYVSCLSKKPLWGLLKDLLSKSFVDVIQTCASTKNPVLAEQLMSQMQILGFEPSSLAYDGVIRALISVHDFRHGVEVLEIMRQKNLRPRVTTLAAMSVSCSEAFELGAAMTFLNQISDFCFPYPFNAFLKACDVLDRPELAVRALAKMKILSVKPDIKTYEYMFSLFGNVNAPYEDGNMWSQVDVNKRIKAIEMDMIKHGINHSRRSIQNLLRAIGMEGMTQELEQRLADVENRHLPKMGYGGIHIYNTILFALVENKSSRKAIEIFEKMIECGVSLNETTYSIMIECCNGLRCYRSALAVVCMMIRHWYHLNAVNYTSLIKILLYYKDFDRALKLLDQAASEWSQRDVVMYNTIIREASENGRIDVIELIVEMMHREKIEPDPSTCGNVLSAYVDNGFDSTGIEALQVLSMRMISEEGDVLEEKRFEYENLIFSEDPEAESHIIEIFKDNEFLAMALLNLRWCATYGLPLSWSPNESPWAKRLASDYASRHICG